MADDEEVFLLSDKNKIVKALGIELNCAAKDVRITVNGVDITRNIVLDEVRITIPKKTA